ncbi:MAG: type IV conjugative transfer system protein TraL [Rhodocyclaceae bacterium]|nr:type IV conjugative transfer system protein TraL [Opitutaceae bacterium]MCL4682649.1 type IV conjugative transfer system protein TraL [Rhodocyclaceae bacterium]
MEPVPIPQYIDNPPQILLWEADEIAPVVTLIGLGIITGTLTQCLLISYAVHKVFSHFKSKQMRNFLLHWLFRIGLIPLNRKFTNGAVRYFHV